MTDCIVSTKQGRLRGIPGRDAALTVFRGIPYARAPVGDLRWREPQLPDPWTGIRDASRFSAMCPQARAYFLPWEPFEDLHQSEDCLYLNVFAPKGGEHLPVLVWFHGGAFQGGASNDPMFDGESFAKQGIIVVTVNYRLGILGFMAHPDMQAESPYGASGNFGVLDQIASLKWVSDNIEAFGGDPNTVTIDGQSAGGGSVCNMISSPLAKGLFCRAITQSGDRVMSDPHRMQRSAEEIGIAIAQKLGDGNLNSLRKRPASDLIRIGYDAAIDITGQMCSPYVDGVILPLPQEVCLSTDKGNNVPMIVGSNLDEGFLGPNAASYKDSFSLFGDKAEAVAAAYPKGISIEETMDAVTAAGSAQWKLRLAFWANKRAEKLALPTWHYQYCRHVKTKDSVVMKAVHSSELSNMWNSYDAYPPPTMKVFGVSINKELAYAMNRYWGNFIKTGDPNGDGLPIWKCKADAPKQHMRLDDQWGMEDDIAQPREELILLSVTQAFGND